MEQNKTGKYFKYAIGEIVLVVIGILIALQINNWNEVNKNQEELKSILINVRTDLQQDIKAINLVFEEMLPRKPYFDKVMYKTITKEEYQTCDPCKKIILGYPDLKLKTRGLNQLADFNGNLTKELQKLDNKINNFYNEMLKEIAIDEKEIIDDFTENYVYWKENTTWFSDFTLGISDDGFIEYALTSTRYRNSVTSFYNIYYEIYHSNLETYIVGANTIISEIDQYLNDYD